MKKRIEIVPYNPAWPKRFEVEAQAIQEALGSNCHEIHHIGSTSVLGLWAKPFIDILAVVEDPLESIQPLTSIGYLYKGELNIPRQFYFTDRPGSPVKLHVFPNGHPEIELNLVFRDYLRNNPDAQDAYTALKKKLLSDPSSYEKVGPIFCNYTLYKGDFIRSILKKAGFKRLRILKCNDESEWKTARYFRNTCFFISNKIDDPYTWTLGHPDHRHLIFYQGTEMMGYAHIQLWPNQRAALRMIVIKENLRNHHLGSEFLTLCEQWLQSLGYQSLHVESSPKALSFYRKNCYIEMPFNDPDNHPNDPHGMPVGKML